MATKPELFIWNGFPKAYFILKPCRKILFQNVEIAEVYPVITVYY